MRWWFASALAGAVLAHAGHARAQAIIPGPDGTAPVVDPPPVVDPTKRKVLGVVGERGTFRPVSGATILDERGDIAVTDIDGYFTLLVTTASRELTIAAPGYATINVKIPRTFDRLRVELVPTRGAEVIEIVDTAPEQTKPLSYKLTANEIRVIPGAGNDILRAITVLPAVADGHIVIEADLPPFDSSANRARSIAPQIASAIASHGKVNIIAHSQGGVDARYLISSLGYGDAIVSRR